MINYILRRLAISVVVIFLIAITSFFMIQLPPGDFASTYKAFLLQTGNMTEDQAEAMTQLVRASMGWISRCGSSFWLGQRHRDGREVRLFIRIVRMPAKSSWIGCPRR
ncbi:MAG: hypothetical protein R2854_19400 [Caldilineaceae bacterium]